ncbi:MAG: amidohydrolase [Chloroflexi bacterium]|nr:amidohydrolase [Chloroflexota bacterium]
MLLHNARVITMDPERPYAESVAIRDGRVFAVGGNDELSSLYGAATELVDCEGGTVVPGFNDAHCHPFALAASLLSVDCSPRSAPDIAGIQERIRISAERTPEGRWIRAANYDGFCISEKRPPNRWELDRVSPRHPVFMLHATGQECVLNSFALRLAGITRDTADPPAGRIHRDPGSGEPNGVISGMDQRVKDAIPPLSENELEEGMKLVSRQYLSFGVTSLQDTSWTNGLRHWQAWRRLVGRGTDLPRISMLAGTEALDDFSRAGLATGAGDSRLRVGGLKLALDESTGYAEPPQEDLNSLAIRAVEAGFQVAFHVSDVRMLRASLEAMGAVRRRTPGKSRRFRLEHCAICPTGLLPRIRASGALIVTQPSFLHRMELMSGGNGASGPGRWLYPFATLTRLGISVAFGSDAPLATHDPLNAVFAASTRKADGSRQGGTGESVRVEDALRMHTLCGAYASLEEGDKGSITPGKLADIAVLDGDLRRLDPELIPGLKVVRTIIGGRTVWEN